MEGSGAEGVTVRLGVEYFGGGFHGWARQPGLRSVQGELERALEVVLGKPVALSVAGRTDAGVHALGQVAGFPWEGEVPGGLQRALNGVLADDVCVTAVGREDRGWSARRDARSRCYRYRVLHREAPSPFERGRALWWPHRLEREALEACAESLVGTHDFTAFTPTDTEHVHFRRELIRAAWVDAGSDVLSFEVEANSFLRHMIRVLVGTMLEVGGGRRSLEGFRSLLVGAPREEAGPTAPPEGLYLVSVRY